MKTLWRVLCLFVVIHALLLGGFVLWLRGTGRLDRERVQRAAAVFAPTLTQEAQSRRDTERAEREREQRELEAARLGSLAEGPVTVGERLASEAQRNEVAEVRVERLKREVNDLRRQLQLAQDLLTKQKNELDARHKAFAEWAGREEKLRQDADFKQAVRVYEQLKPKQAKEMFQSLLKDGKEPQVIDYLAAMQLRKAAAVLKEFKTPDEVTQATALVQRLRERGVDPMSERAAPAQLAGGSAP